MNALRDCVRVFGLLLTRPEPADQFKPDPPTTPDYDDYD
jgi:hypothetical protein